jgi:hypothetical protein
MKWALASVFLVLSAAPLSADERAAVPTLWPCVESVVIARIEKVGELLDYSTEDEIVLHPPSYVDIRIRRVLSGVDPPRTLTIVHQPAHQHGDAMFLLGRREGRWIVLGFEAHVARDRDGRYIVPFFEEPRDDDLVPRGWIPTDYLHRLSHIRYEPKTVAWMGEDKRGQPGWARVEGAYSVANRGLVLEDLASLLGQRLAVPCERDAPRGAPQN